MIARLSNQELNANLKRLVSTERKILSSILDHINEVESRKLYLEMAYPSLYEYLVKECGYSGSAAMRRISAARFVKEVPSTAGYIINGSLNLSQIGELSRAIKEKEKSGQVVSTMAKSKIVEAISGKTTEHTQKVISQCLNLDLKAPERTFTQKDESVHLQLTLTQEQFQNLMKCRDSAAGVLLAENGDVSMASIIGLLAEQFLAQKKLKTATKAPAVGSQSLETENNILAVKVSADALAANVPSKVDTHSALAASKENLTLTPKTKGMILNRDLCCQYTDLKSGKICGSTFNLEVDHKQPRWANGSHAVDNLQTLCRAHNNFKYQKEVNLRLL